MIRMDTYEYPDSLDELAVNVAILTIGCRGAAQAFVAPGRGLKEAGYEVTVATGRGFAGLRTKNRTCTKITM